MIRGLGLAFAVVVVSVAGTVAAGEWNRSGGVGGVALREGHDYWRPGVRRTGEAATIRLQWTMDVEGRSWFDDAKLEGLGIRRTRDRATLPKLVWLVLARRDSLLTVVDAGRDPAALMAAWPDRDRQVLVRGLVGTYPHRLNIDTPGYVQSLVPKEVSAPRFGGDDTSLRLRTGRLGWPVLTP
jgi:hypothetical protein